MLTPEPPRSPDLVNRRPHRPLRVAVLCSHRAPGILHLLNRCPDRGVTYEIVCCVTSESTFAEEVRVERRGVPTLSHPIRDFYTGRGAPLYHDMETRAEYDAATLDRIDRFLPDLVVFDGYLYLATARLLDAFPQRIVNLHFSDLTLRRRDGGPMFPGIRAVRDAITAGCHETRGTVHLVDEQADAGAPIVCSWPFPVSPLVDDLRSLNAVDVVKAYVFAHQQWMMRTVSGPLLAAALRLIATGSADLQALAAAAEPTPWLLDRQHALHAPEAVLAAH